jgi:hypothetical protein
MLAQDRLTMNSKPSLETRVTYSVGELDSAMVDCAVAEELGARMKSDQDAEEPQAEIASSGDRANERQ